jgi:transposase-like protein
MAKRRYFKREFKLQILEQLKNKSVVEVAKENDIHPIMIYRELCINPFSALCE